MTRPGSSRAASDIWIVGQSCRLPGADSLAELWSLLIDRRCAIGEIGEDRWPKARFLHPRPGEPGKAYTFRAGVLAAPWSFDAGAFGLSQREAEQIDPQQRLALELTWEALEDAGIAPSRLAGAQVGVFVGTSSFDHGNRRVLDPSGGDAYYMTGSALSLVANRISYCFDLKGPSLVVDTACSSSLVALHYAVEAIRSGAIDTAVVASVNMLLSPFSFIGFSQARMLSPEGLCRAFGANGQGYVRSEGGAALILSRSGAQAVDGARPRARILATGVNSDGRTVGVSLPSESAQATLLGHVYAEAGIDPDRLAFVEAHGTGTRVGDPVEARAIGMMLGRRRRRPLPIGSIKSNIGHLEPASGLAGIVKATLALEHDLLPATLHVDELNPDIPFDELNLHVARHAVPIGDLERPRVAGISTFGFGGTNAHVVIADPSVESAAPCSIRKPGHDRSGARSDEQSTTTAFPAEATSAPGQARLGLLLSAHSEPALQAVAARLGAMLSDEARRETDDVAAALVHHRERLPERALVLDADPAALTALARGEAHERVVRGRAAQREADTAFVFSGNGSQWAGMALAALEHDRIFRRHLEHIAGHIERYADWSVLEALTAQDLAARLVSTTVAQPLLLAIQVAAVDTLAEHGIEPRLVVGHSVGEVAAAYAAGILDRDAAARVVVARSAAQEFARGTGRMAVLHVGEGDARSFIERLSVPGLEIAAVNSPSSVTLVAPGDHLAAALSAAERAGLAGQMLDIAYPFHSSLMDGARLPLREALATLAPKPGHCRLVSTVTGREIAGERLDADYWWRNVREPVLFADAVSRASDLGARVVLEIGPRPILRSYLEQILGTSRSTAAVVTTFARPERPAGDTVRIAAATAIVRGAAFDQVRAFGPRPESGWRRLPHYPWQRQHLPPPATTEALGGIEAEAGARLAGSSGGRRLLGFRTEPGSTSWHTHLDTVAFPELADHQVGGKPWLAAAAFADMALTAASEWLGQSAELYDLDILRPLVLSAETSIDARTRIDPETQTLEIASRRRLSEDDWQTHVRARFTACDPVPTAAMDRPSARPAEPAPPTMLDADAVYQLASSVGLDYGPHFRRVTAIASRSACELSIALGGGDTRWPYASTVIPPDLDGAFQGLLALLGPDDPRAQRKAFIPVRLGRLRLWRHGAVAAKALVTAVRATPFAISCDIVLTDDAGAPIAEVSSARFAATPVVGAADIERVAYHVAGLRRSIDQRTSIAAELPLDPAHGSQSPASAGGDEALLLLDAGALRVAYDALSRLRGESPAIAPDRLSLLKAIASRGDLVRGAGPQWSLVDDCPLPPLAQIVTTVVAEHPDWIADCALLADVDDWLAGSRDRSPSEAWKPAEATWRHFATGSPRATAAARHVRGALAGLLTRWARGEPVRLLLLGADVSVLPWPTLEGLDAEGRLDLVIADTDAGRLSLARAELHSRAAISWLDVRESAAARLAARGPFDLAVAVRSLGHLGAPSDGLAIASGALAAGGRLLAIEPGAGAFNELVHMLAEPAASPARLSRPILRTASEWERVLREAPLLDVVAIEPPELLGTVVVSALAPPDRAPALTAHEAPVPIAVRRVWRVSAPGSETSNAMLARLEAALGMSRERRYANGAARADGLSNATSGPPTDVVLLAPDTAADPIDPAKTVRELALSLRDILAAPDGQPARLWIVAPGGMRHNVGMGRVRPVSAGIWAMGRTAINESPGVDIRLVDIAEHLDPDAASERLVRLLTAPGQESEIVLTERGPIVVRIRDGLGTNLTTGTDVKARERASRLDLTRPGSLRSLDWRAAERRPPGDDEVEIEVAASGLNFRDVMWAMGLLPAEALEDGFAGATVGFECAGRIVRVGRAVEHLGLGDPVIAMAPAALASHVTVIAAAVARVPDGIDLAAATTVPVAFLTAHYALEHLARLKAGERVLIHGGAGGVGLAALQIAQARGARTFVTAGTPEKRALLKLIGADHVLSSRSLAFADEIRAIAPEGVDVVLNSLSGEAMERSLELLRPFGRFLELGKRDFYENTKLALRPFRRNVSYLGIDVDQLMRHDPALTRELMAGIVTRLRDGELRPLPYRVFEADGVAAAFRLMQQSGHIGKIVVRPPPAASIAEQRSGTTFEVAAEGAHIVVGGLGGFGMATARWLADRGARTLVLVSRSANPRLEAARAIHDLTAKGVTVIVEACDVADAAALSAVLERLRASGHAIRSVFHSAMVIEDGSLAQTSAGAIERVLRPKVDGARHLDRLTRGDQLDHFVLYSSATTLLGNPGQAAYVAANGYLEGLAHARHADGLPALAVAWGAIADAGYLTRNERAAQLLKTRSGVLAMTASEALRHLETLLQDGRGPVATIAPMDWSVTSRALPILRRPAYEQLAADAGHATATEGGPDLAMRIAGLDDAAASELISRSLAQTIAAIMRAAPGSLDTRRPLAEMGIDSLMTVELRLAVEEQLGLELPVSALSAGTTIEDLSARMLQRFRAGRAREAAGDDLMELVAKHTAAATG
ncbi:MAG: SDR family NAD(P)-dependent oxidoreductase [Hyphomicrobiaceae bacterium]|nr:SDR family NAD(P)-dependent oxidoreductase [Hyphomicrobiaceae bacterium]